jgi:hypothetical protein
MYSEKMDCSAQVFQTEYSTCVGVNFLQIFQNCWQEHKIGQFGVYGTYTSYTRIFFLSLLDQHMGQANMFAK